MNDDCETQWEALEGQTGENAELVMDLQLTFTLGLIMMKNGGAGGGIKGFTLWGSKTLDGPWVSLIASEMAIDNGQVCLKLFQRKC